LEASKVTISLILLINIAAAGILLTLLALTMRLPFKLASTSGHRASRRAPRPAQSRVATEPRPASDHRAPSRSWQTILDDGS
jgi:hypothetical protein